METYKHLDLAWCKAQFLEKPNTKLARWYLQALIREAAVGRIDLTELHQGMEEIKLWQRGGKK